MIRIIAASLLPGDSETVTNDKSFGTFSFEASFDARRANLARRTSRYVERVCDVASQKSTK